MKFTAASLTLLAVLHCVMSAGVRAKAPQGGNASVHCPYSRGSENYPKYFSKGRNKTEIVRVNQDRTLSTDSRFSLEDDRERREFTVTIRNLSVEDAGQYWCGVDKWGADKLTEVNLDVFQPSTETSYIQNGQERQTPVKGKESSHTDHSAYLGGSLAVVVLLCGIISAIFFRIRRNNAKRAAASTLRKMTTESKRDTIVYEDIFPTNTSSSAANQRPVRYDVPAPNLDQQAHSVLRPSCARGQGAPPESVVYSFVGLPKDPPADATPAASAETASLHYATVNFVQSSHVVSDSSAFSGKSHDIYATIQPCKDQKTSAKAHQMASVSCSEDETRPL